MYQQQPYNHLPAPSEYLKGAWLNAETVLGEDYSSAGDDLTVVNPSDVKFTEAGATFGGTNGYLRRAEANWNSGDSAGAILAWVKIASALDGTIFASCDEGGSTQRFYCYITSSNQPIILVRINNVTTAIVRATMALSLDVWHRVIWISTGTGYLFFVDGQPSAPVIVSGGDTGDWLADVPNRDNVTIGARQFSATGNYFSGEVKDVRYLSKQPSSDEIAQDFKLGVPDDDLRLWLPGEEDHSRFAHALTYSGGVVRGMWIEYDGTNGKVDCGDLGNIQQFSTIVEPASTSEQVVQLDTNKHITIAAGTVTYTGLTAVDTFVDGARGTTLVANKRQFLVCQFAEVDANNFEIGWDGVNYGQIKLRQTKVRADIWTARRVGEIYDELRRFV